MTADRATLLALAEKVDAVRKVAFDVTGRAHIKGQSDDDNVSFRLSHTDLSTIAAALRARAEDHPHD